MKVLKNFIILIFSLGLDVLLFNAGLALALYLRWKLFWVTLYFNNDVITPKLLDVYYSVGNVYYTSYMVFWPLAVTLPALVFVVKGFYSRPWADREFQDLREIWIGVIISMVVFAIALMLERGDMPAAVRFSTGALIVACALNCFLLSGWRLIWRALILSTKSTKVKKAIAVGEIDSGVFQRILESRLPRYEFVGVLRGPKGEHSLPTRDLGPFGQIYEVIKKEQPDEVFINSASFDGEDMFFLVQECERSGVFYRIIPSLYNIMATSTNMHLINDIPMFEIGSSEIAGWDTFLKRITDVMLASILLIPAVPILLVACIAIVLESKGWPVFTQERVGQYGRRFKVFKLRTMFVDAARSGGELTAANDPRITRVGKFLRKTSIDELPQLFNVLLGDMSMIGPRAVIPYVVSQFSEWEKVSLNVKPGLSGLAQVSGRDEIGFKDKSLLNIFYIRTYSFALDLQIVLRTMKIVLTQVGTEGTRVDSSADKEASPPKTK